MCKKAYLEKHTLCTPQILLENHTSGKLITKLFYSAVGTTVLENVVRRNGKKPSHNKFFYNYLEPLTQADHNS